MEKENNFIDVRIDDSGVNEFIKFSKEKNFSKERISELFECTAYKKLVQVGGPNIGINSKQEWVNLFYKALNSLGKDDNLESKDMDGFLISNICKTVYNTVTNIESFENVSIRVINEIKSKKFIKITKQFIVNEPNLEEITINLVVFMDNCFGVKNQMILDVQLLGKLGNEAITAVLAHELHHMLRHKFDVGYKVENRYNVIFQIMHWFENEGTADMCNLHITGKVFEDLGFIEKGELDNMFNNVDTYLRQVNELFLNILNEEPYDKEFYRMFSRKSAYHPVGNTMARRIIQILGIDVFKSCVGNQLKFLLEYQNAAEQVEEFFTFDKEVIEGVKKIFVK